MSWREGQGVSTLLFDEPYYIEINEARWPLVVRVVAEVAAQVPGGLRTCVDVGSGPGWFTERLVNLGLEVVGLEGRQDSIAAAEQRVPTARFERVNVESAVEMGALGTFDLVFCFGLLYHTENPFAVVRNLERLTGKVLFIESQVLPTQEAILRLISEGQNDTQGLTYHAIIPSTVALVKMLQTAGFEWVAEYTGRIDHQDFVDSPERYRRRHILLASRQPLEVAGFRELPPAQTSKWDFTKSPPSHVVRPPVVASTEHAPEVLQQAESHLRALHALRPEARLQAGFEPHYVRFLHALRERLHPGGTPDVRTVALSDGLTLQVDLGDRLGCDIYYGYVDKRFEAGLFESVLGDGDTMLDVGAGYGYVAVRCARAVGPTGVVHAIEPDPSVRELLTANAALNQLDGRMRVHACAITDTDGSVAAGVAEEGALSRRASAGRPAVRDVVVADTHSLDSFAAEHRIERIEALRVDIAGHEASVLRGAVSLLRRSPDPLVLVVIGNRSRADDTRARLTDGLAPLFDDGFRGLVPDLAADGGLRELGTAEDVADLPAGILLLLRPGGARDRRVRAVAARLLALGDTPSVTSIDDDPRAVRLLAGLDRDLIHAALRDKAEAEQLASALTTQVQELREENVRLRAQRAALRADVRRLGATPFGLAVLAASRLVRATGAFGSRTR